MKPFLMGVATLIFSLTFYLFIHDYNENKLANNELRIVCEEASVAGSLFIDLEEYSEGRIVFNRGQGDAAIRDIIIESLKLDESLSPKVNSYWRDPIKYEVYYFDDSDATPELPCHSFKDEIIGEDIEIIIKEPQVIVTINAGKGRYTLPFLRNLSDNIRSSSHSWSEVGM